MVRVKYRYILVEIQTDQYKNRLKLPLKESELKRAILDSVETLHGDYGIACIQAGFSIKMYNSATRLFIVRVYRKYHSLLGSSLPIITTVGKLRVGFRTLRLTGTIRSALKFVIQYDREKLTEIVNVLQATSEMQEELSAIIEKCHKRLAKRRLDAD